jgi:hypothetical protein
VEQEQVENVVAEAAAARREIDFSGENYKKNSGSSGVFL